MKKNPSIFIIVLLFSCFLTAVHISTAQYLVGVKSGDWMRYDVTVTTVAPPTQSIKGSIKLAIQTVEGPVLNGTYDVNVQGYSMTEPVTFTLNIATGSGGYASGYVIPANLTTGDIIPGEGTTVGTLGDWHGRRSIMANATAPFMGFAAQVSWDQATGILLETGGSAVGATYTISLAETSLWSSGLFGLDWTLWVLIIVIIVAAVASAGLILRRRRGQKLLPLPRESQSPPPPPPPPPS